MYSGKIAVPPGGGGIVKYKHLFICTCGLTNDAPSIYGRGCTDIEQFL
jgi:hypothetical protein